MARVIPLGSFDSEPGYVRVSSPKPRLRLLLGHFAAVEDDRAAWRVMYPLREVLFLVVCASICSCDDYDEIVEWGEARLGFLRRYLDFHWGVPCADWLRSLMNRVDPQLFSACFMAWVAEGWPGRPDLLALDGKTSRGSHDRKAGQAPLHLVSAFATNTGLVLGQEAIADKSCEVEAIPALLDRLAEAGSLKGALVTIDAVACNPKIAGKITGHGADYLLAVKANQPSLRAKSSASSPTPRPRRSTPTPTSTRATAASRIGACSSRATSTG